jgi:predicted  nucleic acid-binding Zn-ribbon protein
MSKELKRKFDKLVMLQQIEIEAASVQVQLADFPRLLAELDAGVAASEMAVTRVSDRLSALQQAYRDQETDAADIQSRIDKSEQKLRSVKTNKEYQSCLKEIDDLKARLSAVEDRMLACLDDIDRAKVSVAAKKEEVNQLVGEVEDEKERLGRRKAAAQQRLDRLSKDRTEIVAAVDPALLQTYETVKRNSGGVAIAIVEKAVCLECHVNLPPQMFNDLLRFDNLLVCPHCQRLIYPAPQ